MSDAADEPRRIEAMDELLEFIEDIDIARDFMTIGGLRPLLKGLLACVSSIECVYMCTRVSSSSTLHLMRRSPECRARRAARARRRLHCGHCTEQPHMPDHAARQGGAPPGALARTRGRPQGTWRCTSSLHSSSSRRPLPRWSGVSRVWCAAVLSCSASLRALTERRIWPGWLHVLMTTQCPSKHASSCATSCGRPTPMTVCSCCCSTPHTQ